MTADTGHLRILMATYNGAPWLQAQLDSFLQQDFKSWSLWVSDDGSSDETHSILERFKQKNPGRVERVLRGPGQGSASNFLFLLTHPDLPPQPVALADQDDVWAPHKLGRAAAALAQHPTGHPAAYASRFYVTDSELGHRRLSQGWPRGSSFENALVQNVMSGHSTVLNSAALAQVRSAGRPDVPYHDWWIYQVMTGSGCAITLDDEPTLFYRQHGSNVLGTNRGFSAWKSRVGLATQRHIAQWVSANCAALEGWGDRLTPDAATCLAGFSQLPRAGLARARGMARLGIHRQSNRQTTMLRLAALVGHV